jgi:hypothetical protein
MLKIKVLFKHVFGHLGIVKKIIFNMKINKKNLDLNNKEEIFPNGFKKCSIKNLKGPLKENMLSLLIILTKLTIT